MSDFFRLICYIGFVVCWFKAVIYDVGHSNLAWTLVDFLIVPLGVIRGFILMLT